MSDTASPVITLETDRVALGPIRKELVPLYQRWINDMSTSRFLRTWPVSMDAELAWYTSVTTSASQVFFTIYERVEGDYRPIGGIDFHDIDPAHRTAELGVMIGEADARGRGLGTEAVRLMCDYGFNALELHSIMLVTFGWNAAGQRAYTRAGFREIGRRREARYFAGRWWDSIYYDLLRSEFESPVVKRIMTDGIPSD